MRQDVSSFMFGSGVTLLVCTVLAWSGDGFSLLTFTFEISDIQDIENFEMERGDVYLGAITMMAFVVFGSTLMARVGYITKDHSSLSKIAASIVTMCCIAVLVTQTLLIITISITTPTFVTIIPYAVATLILLSIIIACYVWIQPKPEQQN